MTNQEAIISAIVAAQPTAAGRSYEEVWHVLFDSAGIADRTFNERMLLWINDRLSTSYDNLPQAMNAYAVNAGFENWSSMSELILETPEAELLDDDESTFLMDDDGSTYLVDE